MYPKRLLTTAGLLAFLGGMVALAPLAWVLKSVPDPLSKRLLSPAGTIWQGSARINTAGGPVQIRWDAHPARLLLLTLAADWKADGSGLSAEGNLGIAPWGYHLQVVRGEVGGERLSRVMPGTGAHFDQPLLLSGLDLQLSPGKVVERASGRMAWGPGLVRVGGRSEPLLVPALRGQLRRTDRGLQLQVDGEAEPGGLLASIDIGLPLPSEMHLKVTDRAMRRVDAAAGAPPRSPDTVAFELRQQLR